MAEIFFASAANPQTFMAAFYIGVILDAKFNHLSFTSVRGNPSGFISS